MRSSISEEFGRFSFRVFPISLSFCLMTTNTPSTATTFLMGQKVCDNATVLCSKWLFMVCLNAWSRDTGIPLSISSHQDRNSTVVRGGQGFPS